MGYCQDCGNTFEPEHETICETCSEENADRNIKAFARLIKAEEKLKIAMEALETVAKRTVDSPDAWDIADKALEKLKEQD